MSNNLGMTLAQLQAAVITETNRPDLVAETLQAVLEATQSVHLVDYWYKDLVEAVTVFEQPTQYLQTLDTSVIPLFRDMAYIRKSSPFLTAIEQTNSLLPQSATWPANQFAFINRVDIGDILDRYGYERQDIWYQAGQQINIKSSTPLQFATLGYYQYPNCDPTGVNYNSWIAREIPYAIVYKASGSLFAKIGEDKSWSIYMKQPIPGQGEDTGGQYYQQLALLKRSNIRPGD